MKSNLSTLTSPFIRDQRVAGDDQEEIENVENDNRISETPGDGQEESEENDDNKNRISETSGDEQNDIIANENGIIETTVENKGESDEEDDEDDHIEILITPWNQNSFIGNFVSWMCSVDGKARSLRQARQHARHVEVIIKDASDGSFDVNCIFQRQAIREKWLNKVENEKKSGTIKSYLYSLIHFYKYLICDKPDEFQSNIHKCQEMTHIIQNWITVYRKKCAKEHWKKDLEDLEQMITPQQISSLDRSNTVAAAKKILSSFVTGYPSFKDFTLARDYLMMYICIDNASRTGAIANMTIREFKNAKIDGGSFVVKVLNHKTLATAGPACIVFRKELYNEAENFLTGLRESFSDLDTTRDDSLFISFAGKKMSSSMVTAQLNSFWQKALGKGQHRFNATKIRKASVTITHNKRPEMKKQLSNLMVHSTKMADKVYYLQDRAKQAAETAKSLREVIREYDEDETEPIERLFQKEIEDKKIRLCQVRDKRASFPDVLSKLSDDQIRDKIRYIINVAEMKDKVPDNDNNEEVENGSSSIISPSVESYGCSNKRNRIKFSSKDFNSINGKFGMLITGTGTISQSKIVEMSVRDGEIANLVERFGLYRLTEKIRTERKKFDKGSL